MLSVFLNILVETKQCQINGTLMLSVKVKNFLGKWKFLIMMVGYISRTNLKKKLRVRSDFHNSLVFEDILQFHFLLQTPLFILATEL